ncbi:MAG: Uncharacterized protein Athens101410_233 [Parcubacteria group bacterium Athens1014_10]|nr:MAG: Uncharacterized protein Athens101410_233 [Parcubacteria group bacterium Athens1014_10]TSD04751.1 MAG: Uncharacterized protein Athens071412_626 [Parcubacteria group bacterium Athens0714_12]
MITLNLLPEKEKIIYKQEKNYLVIKNFLLLLIIATIIITIALLASKLILEKNFYSFVDGDSLSPNATAEIKKKINNINSKLQEINGIQKNYFDFSEPLIILSGLTPANLQISLLNLDQNNLEFFIKGKAKTRENLLRFQKNLEDSPIFKEVKYPITNLLSKENINFEFSGKLNPLINSNQKK